MDASADYGSVQFGMAHSTNSIDITEETSTSSSYAMLDSANQIFDALYHTITLGEFLFDNSLLNLEPYHESPPQSCTSQWQPSVCYAALQTSTLDLTSTPNHPDGFVDDFQPDFNYLVSSIGGQFDPPYMSVNVDAGTDDAMTSCPSSSDFSVTAIWNNQSSVDATYLTDGAGISRGDNLLTWPESELILSVTRSSTVSSLSSSTGSDSDTEPANNALSCMEFKDDRRHLCDHENCTRSFDTAKQLSQHKRCHSKRYRCKDEACRKNDIGFGTRRDLERHERAVHEGERKECPHCRKRIKRFDNLRRHIATMHKNSKPNKLRLQSCMQQKFIDDSINN